MFTLTLIALQRNKELSQACIKHIRLIILLICRDNDNLKHVVTI